MKKRAKLLIVCSIIIVIANIPPVSSLFRFFLDEKHYRYSNYDGSNTSYEFMSRDYNLMKRLHTACLQDYPNQKDKKLYRLFAKNPLAFWRWRLYFFDERYDLPYKNWNEIERLRKKKSKNIIRCHTDF